MIDKKSKDKKEDLDSKIKQIRDILIKVEEKRKTRVIVFFSLGSIETVPALSLLSIIRKEPLTADGKLDLILESGGGSIDSAAKISHICKEFSKEFSVIVPFYAKSAATLIALYADKLFLCGAGELGPLDPQVKHPAMDLFFPASSIKDALEFIESSKDPVIKMTMADKLDPFLIGAYRRAIKQSKQYLEEIPLIKSSKNKTEIIEAFTQKYIDHGYPITHKICEELKINSIGNLDKDIENLIYDIHEKLIDLMVSQKLDLFILTRNSVTFSEKSESELIEG